MPINLSITMQSIQFKSVGIHRISALNTDQHLHATPHTQIHPPAITRRQAMLSALALPLLAAQATIPPAYADEAPTTTTITVVDNATGTGTAAAQSGDIVLIHYVGRLEDGTVFDSTLGGLKYRDGGEGVLRPALIKLGGDPTPGIVSGLTSGIQGMKIGGKRAITVPAELGFGTTSTVLAPYAIVPPNSVLRYDVELIRLSRRGPDAIMSGVSGCGGGAVMERTQGCAAIYPEEYL